MRRTESRRQPRRTRGRGGQERRSRPPLESVVQRKRRGEERPRPCSYARFRPVKLGATLLGLCLLGCSSSSAGGPGGDGGSPADAGGDSTSGTQDGSAAGDAVSDTLVAADTATGDAS